MAVRGHQKGKFYSEFNKESADGLKQQYEEADVLFLNDVEGMAYSLIYHERLQTKTFI